MLQKLFRIRNFFTVSQRTILYKNNYSMYKENNVRIGKFKIIPLTVMGLWGIVNNNDEDKDSIQIMLDELITKADTLYDQRDYRNMYDLLSKYKDSKNVEILWRLSRAIYKILITDMSDGLERQKLICEGYYSLCTALDIKEDHYAVHKWMSVFLNEKSALNGIKAQLKEAHNIKKHIQRAIELNPNDPMLLHTFGRWCDEISSLPWYKQKIVSILFGDLPTSSLEEALMYYEHAEKIQPYFYSHNLLMLGKMYFKLNRKEDGIKYLKKTIEYPVKDKEDEKAKQEAQKILNSIYKK